MDIDRLKKLSGLNEKRPGDRGFTPGVQEPEDRLKKDRGFIPGKPEPGQEPGDRGFIPGAPQVPPMPTPDKPNPKPSPGGPRPDRPNPKPSPGGPRPDPRPYPKPSPGGPPVPKPDPRPGIDFPGPSRRDEIDSELIYMPNPDWDGWDKYDQMPDFPKKDDDTVIKSPSLRDYLKMIRRS